MAETLGGVVHGNMVMAAGQQSVEEQRVNVALEVPAVHLDAELVTQHQCDGERVVLPVILAVLFSTVDHLLEGNEVIIGDGQRHIGQHLDPLLYPHGPVLIPDRLTVILLVHGDHLMDSGECLALAEQADVGHQLAGPALVPFAVLEILEQVNGAIAYQLHRVEEGAADGGTERQHKAEADKYDDRHIRTSAS